MRRLTALLVSLLAAHAVAFETRKDSAGDDVRWLAQPAFVVQQDLDEVLDAPGAKDAVRAAIATVNAAVTNVGITAVDGQTSGVGYDAQGGLNRNEILAATEWSWEENAVAVTIVTVNSKTHVILDADIALNAEKRKFKVLAHDGDGAGAFDDIQNTVTHELGHALGLAHNPGDSAAVMYPSTHRGEVRKRMLSADDLAGLAHLYGAVALAPAAMIPGPADEAAGCSSTGGSAGVGLVPVLAILALLRRKRATVAAATLLAGASFASGIVRAPAPVQQAKQAARGEVVSVQTVAPAKGQRILTTLVRVHTVDCVKGDCPSEVVLTVPGGKLGEVEQLVEGQAVPAPGEPVAFTVAPGDDSLLLPPARVRLYRLNSPLDAFAFSQGVAAAGSSPTPR